MFLHVLSIVGSHGPEAGQESLPQSTKRGEQGTALDALEDKIPFPPLADTPGKYDV